MTCAERPCCECCNTVNDCGDCQCQECTAKVRLTTSREWSEYPCDCEDGPCGWLHREFTGPTRYFADGREVPRGEFLEIRERHE